MKSNAYLRFPIAIFAVNVSWQYKLFKRYRFGVFRKTEHIFAHDDFSKTKYGPLHQETLIYNCQTARPRRFNVDLSRKNSILLWFLWRFFLVFLFIFHCFLMFSSVVFESIIMLKMCVSGRYSLLTLCNFVFKRPTQAPRTVNYVIS
jgi:hypothetical protein